MCLFSDKSECEHDECKQFYAMNEIYGIKNNTKLNDDYLLKKRNAIDSNIDYSHGQSNRKDLAKYKLLKGPNGSQIESLNVSTREGMSSVQQNGYNKPYYYMNGSFNTTENNGAHDQPKGLQCFLPDVIMNGDNSKAVGKITKPYMNDPKMNGHSDQNFSHMPHQNGYSPMFYPNNMNGYTQMANIQQNGHNGPNHLEKQHTQCEKYNMDQKNPNHIDGNTINSLENFVNTREGLKYLCELKDTNLTLNTNLQTMKNKQDNIEKVLTFLVCEIQNTHKVKELPCPNGLNMINPKESYHQNIISKNANDNLTEKDLKKILADPTVRYQYKLVTETEIETPLVRERNFALNVKLVDSDGEIVRNSNKMLLNVNIYTEDLPPINVQTNTQGQKSTKGGNDKVLEKGECSISKLQIREVTSHYRNGKIFIVVLPSEDPLSNSKKGSKNFVDYSQIEPLIISDIVVKAKVSKKSAKGDTSNENGKDSSEQNLTTGQLILNGHTIVEFTGQKCIREVENINSNQKMYKEIYIRQLRNEHMIDNKLQIRWFGQFIIGMLFDKVTLTVSNVTITFFECLTFKIGYSENVYLR